MRVLFVDLPPLLADPLRTRLSGRAEITVCRGDLLDPNADLAAGHDVVIHALGVGQDDEDQLMRSTLGTWNLLHSLPRGRYVQLSSMNIFDGYEEGWDVREGWHPRPTTDPSTLACHLGEIASRDITRGRDIATMVVRLDEVIDGARFEAGPVEPRWIHLDDAITAILTAIRSDVGEQVHGSWTPLHAVRGDGRFCLGDLAREPFAFRPTHQHPTNDPVAAPTIPALASLSGLTRPERLTLLGAGGPIGAAASDLLTDRSLVRATDVTALAEMARRPPQSVGAPVPQPLPAPHENLVVDITDAEQVRHAAVGADCLVNLSVVREDPVLAFRVNFLGAWHTVRAAVDEGVPRVVHTGPTLSIAPYPWGNTSDGRIDGTQGFRSGGWIYLLTKMLGQEICRITAEAHALACPVLLYCGFALTPPARRAPRGSGQTSAFAISWADSGRSIVAAADVAALPEPSPVINIVAPQPHDQWPDHRAREILGWQPTDRLDELWFHPRVAEG